VGGSIGIVECWNNGIVYGRTAGNIDRRRLQPNGKVISYGDSGKNYITRLARKVKEIAGTAKEKSLPEALRKTTNKVAMACRAPAVILKNESFGICRAI
jgi:hypothetical protein